MLTNLIDCLFPQNQMESLLVEKIAMDFWRLRRLIRFETGSIGKCLEAIFKKYYDYSRKNNEQIDKEIQANIKYIEWIATYVEYLKKGKVSFDQPIWKEEEFESDIIEDYYLLAKTINELSLDIRDKLSSFNFVELRNILPKYGYSTAKEISAKLIEIYAQETRRLQREIRCLEQNRLDD